MDVKELMTFDYIDRVEDLSTPSTVVSEIKRLGIDLSMARMRIFFKNGRELSVIKGPLSHGGSQGLYEIAIIGKNDNHEDLYDENEDGGVVLGYLDTERVRYYIHKIGVMP